jgi:hypothetical protein
MTFAIVQRIRAPKKKVDRILCRSVQLPGTVLICMDTYSRHFFLLLRRRFHREVILAVSAFGSTG